MDKTAKSRMLHRIKSRGKGWVFSAIDFLPDLKHWEVRQSFVALENEGVITRVLPGLYYYPEYSILLKKNVAPDIQKIAKSLARKFNWKIFPEGNVALNFLALSTQVPANYVYISSGSPRKYKIGGLTLEFRHRMPKESTISNENAQLVIQAMKSLGRTHASEPDFIKLLSTRFSPAEWVKIEAASKKVSYWILDIITKAKKIANG